MHFKRMLIGSTAAIAVSLSFVGAASAQTEIQFWHALTGQLGDRVNALAEEFNKQQKDYKVVPTYKGTYTENMTAGIAAFRAKQQPHIIQIFEVGTATMLAAKGAVYPVWKLMQDTGEPFDPSAFVSAVYGYYSTADGKLLSMPFNSSTPVLYWNKKLFQQAGYDAPPKTWKQMEDYTKKLVTSGAKCGTSTGWPSWIQVEAMGAWHDVPFATKQNGFGGTDIELKINDPLRVKHIERLANMAKDKRFVYYGRENKPNPSFVAGDCAMLMASSGLAGGFTQNIKDFEWGIAPLPYDEEVKAAPQNTIIGGATLWVMAGKPAAEYKGVAKFFSYLQRPDVQAQWHQDTGYVPITNAAADLTEKSGFYKKFPGREVATQELNNKPPTTNSKGLRIGNFVQIRDVIDEELEAAFAGQKTAKAALDSAVQRGNKLLKDFHDANK